jgi:ribosomal-protein-alanine N-acetyltransferase
MNNFKITPARESDIKEIMTVELAGFPKGIVEREDVFLERINIFPDGFLLVTDLVSGNIIGYICSEIWNRRDPVEKSMFTLNHGIQGLHDSNGDEIYISSMSTLPAYRNNGIGRWLFNSCIDRLVVAHPNLQSAILIVNETWTHARKIYVRAGFQELLSIEGFFTPDNEMPQAAIVMRRQLTR